MLDLVIVTGAGRGLGAHVVADAKSYARKILAIGSSDAIDALPKSLDLIPLRLDLAVPGETETLVSAALARLGAMERIGLVLCAAQMGTHGGLTTADFAEWSQVFAVNVLGNLAVAKACLPLAGTGVSLRAIFFAGGGAAYGYPEFSGYALSKVAMVRAVENLALEFDARRLDASAVVLAPGAMDTDMMAKLLASGALIKTKTDISEPVSFVRRFLCDEMDVRGLNGRFLHVRDTVIGRNFEEAPETLFKLRRVE